MIKLAFRLTVFLPFIAATTAANTMRNPRVVIPQQPMECRDCIEHDTSTQSACNEVTREADQDSRWTLGLNANIDQTILGGRVIAYKIRWQRGAWSGWFVPGINDIDWKYNTDNNTQRRVWSYFFSHEHHFILCK